MKVFISADIEGVTGVTNWNEADRGHGDYGAAAEQMTREVMAACEAAIECGADEIYIKDGHATGRNIIIDNLPEQAVISRGWSNTPESMMAGIDATYDAAIMIGYHSGAGYEGSPLCHTMNQDNNYVKVNGIKAAEFDLNTYVAAYYDVPVVFVSGDQMLCDHAKELVPEIETCGVKSGWGNATISMSPSLACKKIKEGVIKGLKNRDKCHIQSPEKFEMEVNFKQAVHALRGSHYPGAELLDGFTVKFTGKDIQEMMTARMFIL